MISENKERAIVAKMKSALILINEANLLLDTERSQQTHLEDVCDGTCRQRLTCMKENAHSVIRWFMSRCMM